jgi:hypothetical protein
LTSKFPTGFAFLGIEAQELSIKIVPKAKSIAVILFFVFIQLKLKVFKGIECLPVR